MIFVRFTAVALPTLPISLTLHNFNTNMSCVERISLPLRSGNIDQYKYRYMVILLFAVTRRLSMQMGGRLETEEIGFKSVGTHDGADKKKRDKKHHVIVKCDSPTKWICLACVALNIVVFVYGAYNSHAEGTVFF